MRVINTSHPAPCADCSWCASAMDMEDSDQEELEGPEKDCDSQDELSAELALERRLGFRPQKRLSSLNHLPYSGGLDQEAADNLAKIKLNLATAVTENDRRGFQLYTRRLEIFLNNYLLFMSKEDHVLFVKLYLAMMLRSPTDYRNIGNCSKLVRRLLKRAKRHLTRDDLVIEWRPIYDLYKSFSKHPFKTMRLNFHLDSTPRSVKSVARVCRSFFPVEATEEILAELLPGLCPFDTNATWVLECLEAFLPTDLPPELYEHGWRLWLPQLTNLLQIMENSGAWDQSLCTLMARLAYENPGQIDWSTLRPEVFARLLRSFGLPISYKKVAQPRSDVDAIPGLTSWVVGMLGGGTETQVYLDRLLEAVESYYYASNAGSWQDPLSRFLSHLCSVFVRRLNRERHKKASWFHYTAPGHELSDDDVTRFVKSVLPCALLGIYSWGHSHRATKCLRALAQLRPDLVITPIIESFHQSLESVTEPHRLTSTMNAVSAVLRTMTESGPRPEVVPLLQLVLPGIDPNDKLKTMCTFVLIDRLADMITFVDCSSEADNPELTELEQQACLQTAGMEDVVLQLLSRFLALLEPNSQEGNSRPDQQHKRGSQEETVLPTVLRTACFSILNKASPEIQRCAVLKLRDCMAGRILETRLSGKLAAVICCGAIMANPELGLRTLIPPVVQTILDLSEDVQHEEKLDQELLFNLLLLKEMVCSCGQYLLPYRPLLEQVLERGRHLACPEGAELTSELLLSVLTALLAVYITDHGGLKGRLADPQQRHLIVREWGKCTDMRSLEISWHVPTEEEVLWADSLVHQFVEPELDELELFMEDVSRLNNEQLLCRLKLLHHGLKGASYALPAVRDLPIDLLNIAVDMSPLTLDTGAAQLPSCAGLRARILSVMHRLTDTLTTQRPDDTKSLGKLCTIMETALFHFGVKRSENENEIKVMHTTHSSQGKDFGPKKYSSRTLAAWVQLQHNQRVVYGNTVPFCETFRMVIHDVFKLAINHYSYVRQVAQSVLFRCVSHCQQALLVLWPLLVEMLGKPDITHEQLKGLLYVVIGPGMQSLLSVQEWDMAEALWPALVTCASSEKDSIVVLIEKLRKGTDLYEATPLELQMSEECVKLVPLLWASPPIVKPPITQSASITAEGAERLAALSRQNRASYDNLLDNLLTLMESGTLHWRRYEMCLEFVCLLVRPDVPAPARLVRFFLQGLLHTSIFVRKTSVLALGAILKQQKGRHETVVVEPSMVAALHRPMYAHRPLSAPDGDWRTWSQFGDRANNLWMQYDSATAPRDAREWEHARYVHKMKWGYARWPAQMRVYKQRADGETVAPPPAGTEEAVEAVRAFVASPESVRDLVKFLSLEEHKGRDVFAQAPFILFKGLFRNHGDQVLDALKPHMDRLSEDMTESAQKCLCEIIAGLVRGSKHWPFATIERMWQYLLPLIRRGLGRIHQESAQNWGECVSHCVADRDPNRHHWLLEEMMQPAFERDESMFLIGIRLFLLQNVVGEMEWRGAELLHRVKDMVMPQLDHPYQNIRSRVGGLLTKVYHLDVYGGPETLSPRSDSLVEEVLPRLDILLNTDSSANGAAADPAGNGSSPVSEEKQSAMRVLKTVCQYLLTCAHTMLKFITPKMMELLPHLCAMESYDIDRDLQAHCVRTLHAMAVPRHDAATMRALLRAVGVVMDHPYWRARVAGLAFLQAAAFHNMFLLLGQEDEAQTVTECVVRGLHDARVEVREMAVQVFSGLLHCGFIDSARQQELRSEFEQMACTRLSRRGRGSAPSPDHVAQLRQRHTGVLGLCAFVNAAPYDVPEHLPQTLMTLGDHVNDPPPIQTTIRKTMTNFKRTHHENWRLHRQKFTDDQLTVLTDLLVSPSYYA
ncbi:proteasome activator complex subunit 4B-like isoform X2 [Amphibalanus amphitrite]|uniref:proteasome activator complex subunit 4B-like isoform X2 n=1 Tax=Amphibalanus amphitrite TaxID=1232801 RepID=UPI001C8FFB9A|nr:proteasome activator complex subunit 4B-like isoform X2 [Amphibalanus amphitrite]